MTPLPKISEAGVYVVSGSTLAAIVQCIEERTPLDGPDVEIHRLKRGFYWSGGQQPGWKFPFRVDLSGGGWICQPGVVFFNGTLLVPTYGDLATNDLGDMHVQDDYEEPTPTESRAWWLQILLLDLVPTGARVRFGNVPPPSTTSSVNVWLAAITHFDDAVVQLTGGTLQIHAWEDGGALLMSTESF